MRQLAITCLTLLIMLLSTSLMAQQQWWFDVEVIIFKRDQSGLALTEKFKSAPPINTDGAFDLIDSFLNPNLDGLVGSLPYCFEADSLDGTFGLKEALEYKKAQDELEIAEFEALFGFSPADTRELSNTGNSREQAVEAQLAKLQPWFDSVILPAPQAQWEYPDNFPCVYRAERAWFNNPLEPSWQVQTQIDAVPVELNAPERQFNGKNRLLAPTELRLNQLMRSISRQSDLTLMSHIGWRQHVVFGENRATPLHLFAGDNFAKHYDANGLLKQTNLDSQQTIENVELSLIEQVEAILNSPAPPVPLSETETATSPITNTNENMPLWELDGLFKVYLRLLGQTPYLHIDSQLVFRQEGLVEQYQPNNQDTQTATQLYSYEFNQLRRIISQQVHYFDHPLFGMVVQLRRYHPPQSATKSD